MLRLSLRRVIAAPHRARWRRALTSVAVEDVSMASFPSGVHGREEENRRRGEGGGGMAMPIRGFISHDGIPSRGPSILHNRERCQAATTLAVEQPSVSPQASTIQEGGKEEPEHSSSVVVVNSSDVNATTFYRRELPAHHCVAFR